MQLPKFQRNRLRKVIDKERPWGLVYDTGYKNIVEALEIQNKGIYYPISFLTKQHALNYASWFKSEAFINLRPVNLERLLRN